MRCHAKRTFSVRLVFAAFLAVAICAAVTVGTYAAFTDSTGTNSSPAVESGTVELVDNDSEVAMFNLPAMNIGTTHSRCITVTYLGTVEDTTQREVRPVKLYGTVGTTGLADNVQLTVTEGSGGTLNDCTGYTADPGGTIYNGPLGSFTPSDYNTGVGNWNPSVTGETKTYRFDAVLPIGTPRSAQNQGASASFIWETIIQ